MLLYSEDYQNVFQGWRDRGRTSREGSMKKKSGKARILAAVFPDAAAEGNRKKNAERDLSRIFT